MPDSLPDLEARRSQVLLEIAQLGDFRRGSVHACRKLVGSCEIRPICSQPQGLQLPLRAEDSPRRHQYDSPTEPRPVVGRRSHAWFKCPLAGSMTVGKPHQRAWTVVAGIRARR